MRHLQTTIGSALRIYQKQLQLRRYPRTLAGGSQTVEHLLEQLAR